MPTASAITCAPAMMPSAWAVRPWPIPTVVTQTVRQMNRTRKKVPRNSATYEVHARSAMSPSFSAVRLFATFATIVGLAVALAACGGGTQRAPDQDTATLLLDFTPNAIHAGIYSAIARGYDE